MRIVKKATKITAVILAVILLLAGISYLFLKPLYYRLFYFGDRITGTVSVMIDGEKYELKAIDLSASHDNEKDMKIEFQNGADAAVIYQYNWYNVSRFDLDVSIDHEAGTITMSSTAQVLSENGEWSQEKRATTVDFSDGACVHYIVTV